MTDAAAALRTAALAGEFFTLAGPDGPGWTPLRELVRNPEPRVARVRAALAPSVEDVPLRTAASIDLQGLVARVVSPALGAAALARFTPAYTLDTMWTRADAQLLAISASDGRDVATVPDAVDALRTLTLAPIATPLVAAYADRYRVSTKVLWGNVASALNGAVDVLRASGIDQQLPACEIATELLRIPPLAGTVRSTIPRFVRNSCCLWYRIPGSAICGDCVLSA